MWSILDFTDMTLSKNLSIVTETGWLQIWKFKPEAKKFQTN